MVPNPTLSPQAQAFLAALPPQAQSPDWPQPDDAPGWRAAREAQVAGMAELNRLVLERLTPSVRPETVAGAPCLVVTPPGLADEGPTVAYVHGGAFTFHSAESTLASAALVAQATRRPVVSIDYAVAPEARWPVALDQVADLLQTLGERAGGGCVGYGESAGGGLLAAAVLKLLDTGREPPQALALLSPWADLTATGSSRTHLAAADPLLRYEGQLSRAAAAYCSEDAQRHPHASPVYARFDARFPPTLIQGGVDEVLLSDFVRLHAAIRAGGGRCDLDLHDGLPHVFPIFLAASGAPEADLAYRRLGEFLARPPA